MLHWALYWLDYWSSYWFCAWYCVLHLVHFLTSCWCTINPCNGWYIITSLTSQPSWPFSSRLLSLHNAVWVVLPALAINNTLLALQNGAAVSPGPVRLARLLQCGVIFPLLHIGAVPCYPLPSDVVRHSTTSCGTQTRHRPKDQKQQCSCSCGLTEVTVISKSKNGTYILILRHVKLGAYEA